MVSLPRAASPVACVATDRTQIDQHRGDLVVPMGQVLPRAQELAEQITQRPQLTSKYMAVVFGQRISRRLAEGMLAGMALEGVTAANLAYLQPGHKGQR